MLEKEALVQEYTEMIKEAGLKNFARKTKNVVVNYGKNLTGKNVTDQVKWMKKKVYTAEELKNAENVLRNQFLLKNPSMRDKIEYADITRGLALAGKIRDMVLAQTGTLGAGYIAHKIHKNKKEAAVSEYKEMIKEAALKGFIG